MVRGGEDGRLLARARGHRGLGVSVTVTSGSGQRPRQPPSHQHPVADDPEPDHAQHQPQHHGDEEGLGGETSGQHGVHDVDNQGGQDQGEEYEVGDQERSAVVPQSLNCEAVAQDGGEAVGGEEHGDVDERGEAGRQLVPLHGDHAHGDGHCSGQGEYVQEQEKHEHFP